MVFILRIQINKKNTYTIASGFKNLILAFSLRIDLHQLNSD